MKPFITSQSGGGEYAVNIKVSSIEELHKAHDIVLAAFLSALEPVPAPSGVELTGDFPERIWAGDFDSHGLGHATAGMQGGLYEEYVLASSIALTPLTQEPEPVANPVAQMVGAWDADECLIWLEGCEQLRAGDCLYASPAPIQAEPATGRVPIGFARPADVADAKHSTSFWCNRDQNAYYSVPVYLTSPTPPPVENVGEVTEAMVERASQWFDANFNGLPHTDALVRGVLLSALKPSEK